MMKFTSRKLYANGFLITILLLGITFFLQQYDGFIPCPLCILQRITLCLLGILFFTGSLFSFKKTGAIFLGLLTSLVALLGTLLSGRQVWLQHIPSQTNADCGASLQYLIHVLPFDQIMAKILQGTSECAQKGWDFLSLSLAEWSLICFSGFFVICIYLITH